MRRLFFTILVLLVTFTIVSPQGQAARTERIAAVVNEDAISMSDVNDRLRLIISSSGFKNSKEIREKLTPQVINSLIEEQLKMQEARRLEITIESAEVEQGFATVAEQNKIPADEFAVMLKRGGINVATMKRQIESQIAWQKVIQREFRPQISVSDADVDAVIERMVGNKGRKEYLVAEIALPVEQPEQESDIRQLATRLVGQIKSGQTSFFKVAQQFSKAAGAAQGGNLGWVQEGQLPEELDIALLQMTKSEVSQPIKSLSGYHILFIRDQRVISDETIPSRQQITNTLGTERLERLQRRHLLDLKAAAFIENRVGS